MFAGWRSVGRALARIPKQEADQAREAQLARLQAVRMLLWNQASADPIRVAEALIKLEAREARLRGLDIPTKVAVTDADGGIPLVTIRRLMERVDRQTPPCAGSSRRLGILTVLPDPELTAAKT